MASIYQLKMAETTQTLSVNLMRQSRFFFIHLSNCGIDLIDGNTPIPGHNNPEVRMLRIPDEKYRYSFPQSQFVTMQNRT